MSLLLLLPPALSLAVLGAHFYRAGALPMVLACLLLMGLLAVRRAWAVRVLQLALLAGAAEWLWTVALLVQQRMALGQPWQRMALILVVVALLTAASALVWRHRALRQRCGLDRSGPGGLQ